MAIGQIGKTSTSNTAGGTIGIRSKVSSSTGLSGTVNTNTNSAISGKIEESDNISGDITYPLASHDYDGVDSSTATVTVDNTNRTIKAEVHKELILGEKNEGYNIDISKDSSGTTKINAGLANQPILSFTSTQSDSHKVSLEITQKDSINTNKGTITKPNIQQTLTLSFNTINGQSIMGSGDVRLVTEDIINNPDYAELTSINNPKAVYLYANDSQTADKGKVNLDTVANSMVNPIEQKLSADGYNTLEVQELDSSGQVINTWVGGKLNFQGKRKTADID